MNNLSVLLPLTHFTNAKLDYTILITTHKINSRLKALNQNKAHGRDNVSVDMIKIFGEYIPQELIFNYCVQHSCYQSIWKRGNIAPVHKKFNKNEIKNYRTISLLPISSKVFEKIIFNEIYCFLGSNDLIFNKQSIFLPGDSCVAQLLSITHDIYLAFDANPSLEVRGVFLDISKAF